MFTVRKFCHKNIDSTIIGKFHLYLSNKVSAKITIQSSYRVLRFFDLFFMETNSERQGTIDQKMRNVEGVHVPKMYPKWKSHGVGN